MDNEARRKNGQEEDEDDGDLIEEVKVHIVGGEWRGTKENNNFCC